MRRYIVLAFSILLGFSISVYANPRIVSLAPAVTEIVTALGMSDELVGVSEACDYPVEFTRQRPKTGPFLNPDIALISKLNPTIVIGIGVADSPELQSLTAQGVHLLLLPTPDNIPGLLTAITVIGNAIGKPIEGKQLADSMNLAIQRLRKTRPDRKLSVLAVIWTPPLIAAAGNTLIAEVISSAGGINTLEAGAIKYPKIGREVLNYRNPDVVLIMDKNKEEKILSDSAVAFTKAVLDSRVISTIDPVLIARPGPRIVEGISQLQSALLKFTP
jgi:iron complex transport system substrate-binding protein